MKKLTAKQRKALIEKPEIKKALDQCIKAWLDLIALVEKEVDASG